MRQPDVVPATTPLDIAGNDEPHHRRVINTLGLEPYVPPEPLPEITPEEDVHAVCWLALT